MTSTVRSAIAAGPGRPAGRDAEASAKAVTGARPWWDGWANSAATSLIGGPLRAGLLFGGLAVVPWIAGYSNPRCVAVGVVAALAATLLMFGEALEDRRILLAIFAVGYAARLAALMALTWLQGGLASPVLSPDGQMYARVAQAMADGTFVFLDHPILALGSYDVAHYYFFAGVLLVLGGGLFSVQLVNSALGALTGCLVFSWSRRVVPRFAVPLGAVVALHPSLIALSSVNLLKDPSIVFFSVFSIWAVTGILEARSWRSLALFTVLSLAAVTYLRLGRFYVTAYFEIAFVAALMLFVLHRTRVVMWKPLRVGLALLFVLVSSEAVPMALGWPIGPRQVYLSVHSVLGTSAMLEYGPGLLTTASARRANAGNNASLPPGANRAGTGRPSPGEKAMAARPGVRPPSPRLENRSAWRVVAMAANFVRRLYGPFVWIPPTTWDVASLLQADYLLYPGMLIWYALLPFMVIGLAVEAWRTVTGVERSFPIALLCGFLLIYAVQFFTLNLSHRQRDATLPFLLVFGFLGISWVRHFPRWKVAYAVYWLALVFLALGHTLARTWLLAR